MKKNLQKEFGFKEVDIKKLDGYDNANYLVKNNGNRYILKTYKYNDELLDLVKAENETLLFLQKSENNRYPKPTQFTDGSYIKILDIDGEKHIYRMLSYLTGEFLGNIKPTKKLFQSLGIFLAKMDLKLQRFTNYTIRARQWEWDIQYLDLNKKYINDIPNAKDRNTVSYFFQQFEENVSPLLPKLKKTNNT